jgi:hypothetical protein
VGNLAVGSASFGAPLSEQGVTADLALARSGAATDGCTAITNAADVAGKIAVVDRGTCGFVIKAKTVQDAGAIAMVVADNVAGAPPAGMSGADPTVTIPSVRITLTDGQAVKNALALGTVNGTLGLDMTRRAGANEDGQALLNAPDPVQPGSSISHWDPIARPNLLMEPAINSDLDHSVDLTYPLLLDLGWLDEDTRP